MQTFVDTENRTWVISLTIDAIKRVRGLLDVDLLGLELGDPPVLTRLGTDVSLLCDVIYVLIKPQADKLGVTDEQFGAALGGEVILAAQTVFYAELINFFQGLGRTDLVKAIKAQQTVIGLAITRIENQIDQMDLEAEVEKIGLAASGSGSTNSPGS